MAHSPVKPKTDQRGLSDQGRVKTVVKTAKAASVLSRDKQDSLAEWVNEGGAGGEVKRPPVN